MLTQDRELADRIAAGARFAAGETLTPSYRSELMRLMVVFVDSELAGAAGFCPFINRGPGLGERIVAARMVAEKYAHAGKVLDLLRPFGVDTLLYVRSHAWDSRLNRNVDLGTRRVGGDKRLNVFHYPLEGWEDAITFNLLMGLATGVQLGELKDCSYVPLAQTLAHILPGEAQHVRLGATGVQQAIKRAGTTTAVQACVDYWYRRVADTFGRVDSDHAALGIRFGLRRRSNAEMLCDWKNQAGAALTRLGLETPAI